MSDMAAMIRSATEWAARRQATLASLGAPANGERHRLPTADVVVNSETGVTYIVTDYNPSGDDWASVCDVLQSSGWYTGDPMRDDIGEPFHDIDSGTWFWIVG